MLNPETSSGRESHLSVAGILPALKRVVGVPPAFKSFRGQDARDTKRWPANGVSTKFVRSEEMAGRGEPSNDLVNSKFSLFRAYIHKTPVLNFQLCIISGGNGI